MLWWTRVCVCVCAYARAGAPTACRLLIVYWENLLFFPTIDLTGFFFCTTVGLPAPCIQSCIYSSVETLPFNCSMRRPHRFKSASPFWFFFSLSLSFSFLTLAVSFVSNHPFIRQAVYLSIGYTGTSRPTLLSAADPKLLPNGFYCCCANACHCASFAQQIAHRGLPGATGAQAQR